MRDVTAAFAHVHNSAAAVLDWEIRIIDDHDGAKWAVLDAVVEADHPGTAAELSEDWMAQAGERLPQQRGWSYDYAAQVLA